MYLDDQSEVLKRKRQRVGDGALTSTSFALHLSQRDECNSKRQLLEESALTANGEVHAQVVDCGVKQGRGVALSIT